MTTPGSSGGANGEGESSGSLPGARGPTYVDEFDPGGDFIPDDREARRDDVRNLGSGSAVGISCLVVVLGAVLLFWIVRGCVMG
jgi:hypothetical protein